MVGSVLMQRMREENDFADIEPVFFSTSQTGKPAPDVGKPGVPVLQDAFDIDTLKGMDVIVTCQGGDYTTDVYGRLRDAGWQVNDKRVERLWRREGLKVPPKQHKSYRCFPSLSCPSVSS